MLKRIIRNKKRQPIGIMYADLINDQIEMGWSLCRKTDKFDKKFGEMVALSRLNSTKFADVPHSIDKEFVKMQDWAERHFCKKEE